jgi:hypothetical protein
LKHFDRNGKAIRVGDSVRVVGIPPEVPKYESLPSTEEMQTKEVFDRCLGRTFRIEAFDENRVELLVGSVMKRPAYEETIFLEPEFVELTRKRTRRVSKSRRK